MPNVPMLRDVLTAADSKANVVFSLMVPGKSCTHDTLTVGIGKALLRAGCNLKISEGFLQTMKTTSFSGLCRSQRLVLGYQGTLYAELCDASVRRDKLAVQNKHSLRCAYSCWQSDQRSFLTMVPGKSCTHDTLRVGIGKALLRAGCNLKISEFLQSMKTTSFSGLCRSQRLVLGYQGTLYAELCDASVPHDKLAVENKHSLRWADSCWQSDQRSCLTDGPWQVLHTWYADSRDRQGASACRMHSEGFLQTMKTDSFSGLCRSQRLVLGYQGTLYAELCDASVRRDKLAVQNKHSINPSKLASSVALVLQHKVAFVLDLPRDFRLWWEYLFCHLSGFQLQNWMSWVRYGAHGVVHHHEDVFCRAKIGNAALSSRKAPGKAWCSPSKWWKPCMTCFKV